jgi:hypothetical protein
MKTELLFAFPEFLSNPYFSIGFFLFMCIFAFLWAMAALKATDSKLDLSIREALMAELQSKLNFQNSAVDLFKKVDKENEAVIKSLRYDLSQEKAINSAEIAKNANLIETLQTREAELIDLQDELAIVKAAASEVLVNGMEGWTSVPAPSEVKTPSEFKAAKVPTKRASKSTSKSKAATKPRSLGVED